MTAIVVLLCAWAAHVLLAAQTSPATSSDAAASTYPSAADAVQALLAGNPRAVAFGEYHQQKKTARIPSALRHFTREILPALRAAGATDLVVETWITTGSCGEVERKAVARVDKATQRPVSTENEVVTLLRRAKESGIEPHILQVACKDYQSIFASGRVDYDRLLRLTRDQLEIQIRAALQRPGSRLVVSYGGAIHNDLSPSPDLSSYAFGDAIARAVDGKYLEIDLYVPEYIDNDRLIRREPWYQQYLRAYRPKLVIVIQRGPGSYALVFPPCGLRSRCAARSCAARLPGQPARGPRGDRPADWRWGCFPWQAWLARDSGRRAPTPILTDTYPHRHLSSPTLTGCTANSTLLFDVEGGAASHHLLQDPGGHRACAGMADLPAR
jgi:hypothetical protein